MKRILGRVTKKIAESNNIDEYANKKIVLYDNDRRHCEKHIKDFGDKKAFHYVMDNLEYIIDNPDHVFYIKNKSTLEYYKTLGPEVTVRVKIEPGTELKVKTVFPVKREKIENRIKHETYNKYVVKE